MKDWAPFGRASTFADPATRWPDYTRRAIDIHEGERVDAGAFKALVKAAVAQNRSQAKKR